MSESVEQGTCWLKEDKKKTCFLRGELNENSTIDSRSDQKVQLLTTKSQAMQVILSQ